MTVTQTKESLPPADAKKTETPINTGNSAAEKVEKETQKAEQEKQDAVDKLAGSVDAELNTMQESIQKQISDMETSLAEAEKKKEMKEEMKTTIDDLKKQMQSIKDAAKKYKDAGGLTNEDNKIAELDNKINKLSATGSGGLRETVKDKGANALDRMGWREKSTGKRSNRGKGLAIGGGALAGGRIVSKARKGLKSLFGSNDKPATATVDPFVAAAAGVPTPQPEKPGFRSTSLGKVVKRGAIGVGGFFGIRALINRASGPADPETSSSPDETVNNTFTDMVETDPERAEKANKTGSLINDFWLKTIFHNSSGRKENDMLGETTGEGFVFDQTPGTILANMDTQYSSVSTMLSGFDYIADDVQNLVNKPYYAIKERGEEKITQLLKPVAGIVEGIKTSFRGSDGKLTDEGKKELEKPNATRDEQLHDIFTKYMKIKLWYQTMLASLRRQFANDALGGHATPEQIEAYLDDEKTSAQIDARVQVEFLNLKPIDAAMSLENFHVTNKLPESMQESIDEINTQHATYQNPDIEKVIKNNESPATHAESLKASCWNFLDVLNDPIVKRNRLCNISNKLGMDILANGEGADIDAMADSMGLTALVQGYSTEVSAILKKLENGTATVDDIKNLDEIMESFRMFQIEVTLGGLVKNTSDTETSMLTTAGEWIISRIKGPDGKPSVEKITLIGAVGYAAYKFGVFNKLGKVGGAIKSGGRYLVTLPFRCGRIRSWVGGLPGGTNFMNAVRTQMYKGPDGIKLYKKDLKTGKLKFKDAEKVWNDLNGTQFGKVGDSFEKFLKSELNLAGRKSSVMVDAKLLLDTPRCRILMNDNMLAVEILQETDKITSLGGLSPAAKQALINAMGHNVSDVASLSTRASHLAEVANMHIKMLSQKSIMKSWLNGVNGANKTHLDDALTQIDNLVDPSGVARYIDLDENQLKAMRKIFDAATDGGIDDFKRVSKILSVNKLDELLDGLKNLKSSAGVRDEALLEALLRQHKLGDLADLVKNGDFKTIETIINMFHTEAAFLKRGGKGGWIIDVFKAIAKAT